MRVVFIRIAPMAHGRLRGILPNGEIIVGTTEQALLTAARERLAIGGDCKIRFVEDR